MKIIEQISRISTFYHYMAHIRIPDERRTIKDKRLKLVNNLVKNLFCTKAFRKNND